MLVIAVALWAVAGTESLRKVDITSTSHLSARDVGESKTVHPPGIIYGGDTLFYQRPYEPDESWIFHTSTYDPDYPIDYKCYENFWDLEGAICDIHWWGLSLVYPWANCDPAGMEFEIIFYSDDPHDITNMPPTDVVCTYSNVLPTYTFYATYGGAYDCYYFSFDPMDPCCDLRDGWVSIQSRYSPNDCWFLWDGSPQLGDGFAYQENGDPPNLSNDLSILLTGEPEEPWPNHKMHFPQTPRPGGCDVEFNATSLADDWMCSKTGPVMDIHFWISWMDNNVQPINDFRVGIWSNNPVGPYGHSEPASLLWERIFFSGDFQIIECDPDWQSWLCAVPDQQVCELQDHTLWSQINITNIEDPFIQQKDTIYWLEIDFGPLPYIGWKETDQNWNDDPVIWYGNEWREVIKPPPCDSFIDLAFVITGEVESLYWKPPYDDYAPSGMPDFDQKQDDWHKDYYWTFCGPVAVANCFWWFDSKYNQANPGAPGDGFDEFPLVRDYLDALPPLVGLDDHDPWNVDHILTPWLFGATPPPPPTPQPFIPGPQPPMPAWGELVERLAWYFDTDGVRTGYCEFSGTYVDSMQWGIDRWFEAETLVVNGDTSTLADSLYERTWEEPTFAWVETLVEKCQDVILLVGFWYEDPPGSGNWYRIGGHYLTVAGINSEELLIAVSDPYYDNAEAGGRGRVLDGVIIPHPHGAHGATVHNDAGNVSHDIYDVVDPSPSPGGLWGLDGYPPADWMSNFYNQNVPDEYESVTAPWDGKQQIHTEVEYAVEISPWEYPPDCGDMQPDSTVNIGDVVYLVGWLFIPGSPPPYSMVKADVNHDGIVNIADVVYLVNYLFLNGPPPQCYDP